MASENAKLFQLGLDYIKQNANELWLVKGLPVDYAAAVTANITAPGAALVAADLSIADANAGAQRRLSLAAQASGAVATGANTAASDLRFALVNTTASELLIVFDETTDQAVNIGDSVNFPALTFEFNKVLGVSNNVYDFGLDYVRNNCDAITLTQGIPASFADGNNLSTDVPAGLNICSTMAVRVSGDFTIASDGAGGQRITSAALAGDPNGIVLGETVAAGTDLRVAWLNTGGSELLVVQNETTDKGMTAPNRVNLPALNFDLNAPV